MLLNPTYACLLHRRLVTLAHPALDAVAYGMHVDINADAGESFGRWQLGNDEALFAHITSVNLACGFHAGDPLTIKRSIALAKQQGVAVGAHPGFYDKVGFGRRIMQASAAEVYADVLYQIGALQAFLRLVEIPLQHVKAHGALHWYALAKADICTAIANATQDAGSEVAFVALAGTNMVETAEATGVKVIREAFPERAYMRDGSLAPRKLAGSSIHDPQEAAARAVKMVTGQPLDTLDGGTVSLQAETLCIHGDNPEAVTIAATMRDALNAEGITIKAF